MPEVKSSTESILNQRDHVDYECYRILKALWEDLGGLSEKSFLGRALIKATDATEDEEIGEIIERLHHINDTLKLRDNLSDRFLRSFKEDSNG